jgi:hypothetical protein
MVRAIFLTVATICILLVHAGCSGESRKWELAAENRGDSPCAVAIAYGEDGSRSARVDQLPKGPPQVLVAETFETPLHSVTVKVGADEQVLKPDLRLTAGKRYTVVVTADGKASIVTSDK